MVYLDHKEVKEVVFQTLKVRKRLIKLNNSLNRLKSENLFGCEKYRMVLNDYLTLEKEYSDVMQMVRVIKPQIEIEEPVSLHPIMNQIHNQSDTRYSSVDIVRVLEHLEDITEKLILDFDDHSQQGIKQILYKRQ